MLQRDGLVVLWRNAFPVICDFDRVKAVVLEMYLEGSSVGVKGIFDELFYDRAEVNDDLAGLDLMDLEDDG